LHAILRNGGILIADELEHSLHPDITARILNIFLDKDKNPNNAQLLFTTHNPWFLQDLTKTQIFIIEKNDRGETEVTRLDEIKGVRNDENYFLKYINGEYDGKPRIKLY
jgi:AAA15 family ATPase/GTPase